MSEKTGFYASWETQVCQQITVGQRIELPTLFGKLFFTVKSHDKNFDSAYLENSPSMAAYLTFKEGWWTYNHAVFNPKALVKVVLV